MSKPANPSRRRFLKYAAVAAGAAAVVGAGTYYSGTLFKPAPVESISVGYTAGLQSQVLYHAARDQNLGARHNLNINWVPFTDITVMATALVKGNIDISVLNLGPAASARSEGNPVIAFYALLRPTNAIVTRVDSEIKSVADLKGKSVGAIVLPSITMSVAAALLQTKGVSFDPAKDVTYVRAPIGALVGQMESGMVETAELFEPYVTRLVLTGKFRVVAGANDLWRELTGQDLLAAAWATMENFAKEHPKALSGIIKTWRDTCDYVVRNPQSTFRKFLIEESKITDEKVLDVLTQKLVENVRSEISYPWNDANIKSEERLLDLFVRSGMIKQAPKDFFTNKYNP